MNLDGYVSMYRYSGSIAPDPAASAGVGMDITPRVPKNRQLITGYGDGGFKINGQFFAGSLIVFPDKTIPLTGSGITLASLQPIMDDGIIELVLIGTGKRMQAVDPDIRPALKARNIASDIMDTGAACRTYNVLMSEERRVAAILLAV